MTFYPNLQDYVAGNVLVPNMQPWWIWVIVSHGPITHPPLDKMAAILADDIFKCIFLNENDWIPVQILLTFVPMSPVDNKPALV